MVDLTFNNCHDSNTWLADVLQREYGSHAPTFIDNLREKICIFCGQRKPTSLEELTFSVIVENAELIKKVDSALSHLPHRICWLVGRLLNANLNAQAWRLVPFVAEYGQNRASWFEVVEPSKTLWLTRFRLACEIHHKLKPYSTCPSVGISKILQYHKSIDSNYEEFWKSMYSAVKEIQAEAENGCLEPYKGVATFEDGSNVVLVPPDLTVSDLITESEFQSTVALQKLNKTFATPIVFKPTEFAPLDLKSDQISNLLEHFDPEVISSVDISKKTWSVEELDQLVFALSTCTKLTDISLRQKNMNEEEIVDVAPALSRLLNHHPHLVEIGLNGFQFAGTLADFPLPPVENLMLCRCTFTEEYWNFMANNSDLAIKQLAVSSYFENAHFPSLCSFLVNQAPTLEILELEFPTLTLEELCKILRTMSKFNKLHTLELTCREETDFAIIEKIIIDVMSIHSSRTLLITLPSPADPIDVAGEGIRLNQVIRRSGKANHRPPILVTLSYTL